LQRNQLAETAECQGLGDDVPQQVIIAAVEVAEPEQQTESLRLQPVQAVTSGIVGIDDADPVQHERRMVQAVLGQVAVQFVGFLQEAVRREAQSVEVLRHHDIDAVAMDMRQRRYDVTVAVDFFTVLNGLHGFFLFMGHGLAPACPVGLNEQEFRLPQPFGGLAFVAASLASICLAKPSMRPIWLCQ